MGASESVFGKSPSLLSRRLLFVQKLGMFFKAQSFVSVQDAEHYFELASEPKQIVWHEHCKHELSAQARLDRATFLWEQLGLPRPSQHILDLLEQVPPPVPMGY